MSLKCPSCSTEMAPETAHSVQLQVCPNCGGIWLSGGELRTLVTSDNETIAQIQGSVHPQIEQKKLGPSTLTCPESGAPLDEYHYLYNSPVLIHACADCGGMFIHAQDLALMHQCFAQTQEPPTSAESMKIAMALDIAQHERFMLQQQHLQALFNTFRATTPGWIGLL